MKQDWEFLFGDTIPETVFGIMKEAVVTGTKESIKRGIDRLGGVCFFVVVIFF